MAVQLDGKATEKQRKYLGYLSSQGKEKLGKDFSIRKLASQKGINDWDAMSMEDANRLIKEVKAMLDDGFQVSEQDLIKRIAEKKEEKPEQEHTQAPASTSTTHTYMIQLVIPEDKLLPLTVVLEAMRLGFVVLQEVRA
jgi:hypothetical protein